MKVERAFAVTVLLAACAYCAGCGGGTGKRTSGGATGAQILYVSNQNSNTISAFRIDVANGTLTEISGSPFIAVGSGPGHAAVDPASQFLFVVGQNSATVTSYHISSGGALTTVTSATTGVAPRDVAVHPTRNAVYVVNDSGTVSGFSFDSFGSLFALPGSPYLLNLGAAVSGKGIAIDPAGQLVYAATSAGISVFDVNTDSSLTLRVSPLGNAGSAPVAVAAVPATNFVYSADSGSGTGALGRIFGFSATNLSSSNGTILTPLPGTPVIDGINPVWISVVPSGKFLYVAEGAPAAGEIRG